MTLSTIDSSWYQRPKGIRGRTSAGGIVVRLAAGAPLIALAREGDWPLYVLPKGGVEKGENFEQAARREIEEEAGLTRLALVDYLGQRERLNFARTRWMTVHYYLYTTEQIDGTPTDTAHHNGVWWFGLEDLPPMLWPEQRDLIAANIHRIQRLSGI
jgi:8-oxo-dGTP pyrophosphatase MutT (NUDIX family)